MFGALATDFIMNRMTSENRHPVFLFFSITHPKIFLFLNILVRTAVCEYGQFCHAAKELSRIAKCVTAFE